MREHLAVRLVPNVFTDAVLANAHEGYNQSTPEEKKGNYVYHYC